MNHHIVHLVAVMISSSTGGWWSPTYSSSNIAVALMIPYYDTQQSPIYNNKISIHDHPTQWYINDTVASSLALVSSLVQSSSTHQGPLSASTIPLPMMPHYVIIIESWEETRSSIPFTILHACLHPPRKRPQPPTQTPNPLTEAPFAHSFFIPPLTILTQNDARPLTLVFSSSRTLYQKLFCLLLLHLLLQQCNIYQPRNRWMDESYSLSFAYHFIASMDLLHTQQQW